MHILTKIVGADFTTFLVKFGGHPTPTPYGGGGAYSRIFFREASCIERCQNGDDRPSRFREIWGKRFPFRPPSGGTVNCRWGKLHQGVKLDSKFLHEKNFRSILIVGRDIRGQTKLDFPGPEYRNPIRVPTPVKGIGKHYRQSRIF